MSIMYAGAGVPVSPPIDLPPPYPLTWPTGWPRASFRNAAAFRSGGSRVTVFAGLERLLGELRRLHASRWRVSTNIVARSDGTPVSGGAEPADPGVALYFILRGELRALACDRWNRVGDNLAAIAAHIEALRAMDRYGVGTVDQVFRAYAALPPAPSWRRALGLPEGFPSGLAREDALACVESAFRRLAPGVHPDHGGDSAAFAELSSARESARVELSKTATP